nr:SH3 domain-containing protein C23A1.17-like [Penaeus vannamei]
MTLGDTWKILGRHLKTLGDTVAGSSEADAVPVPEEQPSLPRASARGAARRCPCQCRGAARRCPVPVPARRCPVPVPEEEPVVAPCQCQGEPVVAPQCPSFRASARERPCHPVVARARGAASCPVPVPGRAVVAPCQCQRRSPSLPRASARGAARRCPVPVPEEQPVVAVPSAREQPVVAPCPVPGEQPVVAPCQCQRRPRRCPVPVPGSSRRCPVPTGRQAEARRTPLHSTVHRPHRFLSTPLGLALHSTPPPPSTQILSTPKALALHSTPPPPSTQILSTPRP